MNIPWRMLTIVSLAINLVIVGAAIGFFMSRFHRGGPPPFGGPRIEAVGALRTLPDPERDALANALMDAWRSGSALRDGAQAARRQAGDIVARDPYDEAAVRKALADMRAADEAVLAHYQDALAASLGKLSAEQRRAALRAANRPGRGGPERFFPDSRRGGPPAPPGDNAP